MFECGVPIEGIFARRGRAFSFRAIVARLAPGENLVPIDRAWLGWPWTLLGAQRIPVAVFRKGVIPGVGGGAIAGRCVDGWRFSRIAALGWQNVVPIEIVRLLNPQDALIGC